MTESIPKGRYRHFKGGEYEVIDVARDSETQQPVVVYRALYGEHGLWVRPLAMSRKSSNATAGACRGSSISAPKQAAEKQLDSRRVRSLRFNTADSSICPASGDSETGSGRGD